MSDVRYEPRKLLCQVFSKPGFGRSGERLMKAVDGRSAGFFQTLPRDALLACGPRLDFLQGLPQALAVMRVDLDMMGRPCDLIVVYGNEALFTLFGVPREWLTGVSLVDSHLKLDRSWLEIFWKTAYQGHIQEMTGFWASLGRHLAVTCHQPQYGYCTCLFQDITERVNKENDQAKNRNRLEALLHSTVDMVFQMDPVTGIISNLDQGLASCGGLLKTRSVPKALLRHGILASGQNEKITRLIRLALCAEGDCTCEVRARLKVGSPFTWHSLTVVSYCDPCTHEMGIIAFLKDVHASIKERDALVRRAEKDPLCGIYNRAAGESIVAARLAVTDETCHSAALLIFDLDDFKVVNDTAGHAVGDAVLKAFSVLLGQGFRKDDIIFRLGGDEFAVFVQNMPQERIFRVSKNLASRLEEPLVENVCVGMCVGVAYSQSGRHSYEEFYKMADKALYNAKEGGKGQAAILCLHGNGD